MSRRRRQKMGIGAKVLLVICLMVFCGSGYYLADYFLKAHQAQNGFSALKELGIGGGGEESRHLADLDALRQKNGDLIGWLQVKGTKIDYPVMQTRNDPEYYLHRDFNRDYSDAGTPFMDAASDIDLPTVNWLIYGHHMRSGIMFHDLVKYGDKEFYDEHPTFLLETIKDDGPQVYQIIAACYSQVYPDDSDYFKYYQYAGFDSEEDFNTYVANVKAMSAYETGETAVYGDQLVTLSTCAYHTDDGRFFVVGKRLGPYQ